MKENTQNGPRFAWVRDLAFVAAIGGGAWVVADAIGDLKAELKAEQARTSAKVEHNAVLIERNAKAIERNAEAIARNAEAIGEVKESVAKLTGQYEEHIREHQDLASR